MFSRWRLGKRIKFKGVYSAARKEIWALNEDGSFKDTASLRGEGNESYWHYEDPEQGVRHLNLWMRGRQYISYEDEDGRRVRYGAFLLADWLSAPTTRAVELPLDDMVHLAIFGPKGRFRFNEGGEVEGDLGITSMTGRWWLEAGALHVSFSEGRRSQSWPWQEAATHVGFAVPREALVPWEREEAAEKARHKADRRTSAHATEAEKHSCAEKPSADAAQAGRTACAQATPCASHASTPERAGASAW